MPREFFDEEIWDYLVRILKGVVRIRREVVRIRKEVVRIRSFWVGMYPRMDIHGSTRYIVGLVAAPFLRQ